ncbi:nSTAND1 domain-containing NTPase [Streptomyces violascens]|uniref:nSTAND1 domain-containing NTPase n=1 Tax=Streptomyces violascens TaxID=67381 RepID=UPI00365C9B56
MDSAVLRIRDGRGEPVGVGFLVSDTLALTCAHVVSAALGTPHDVAPGPSARIQVDLPLVQDGAEAAGTAASVEQWVPPRPYGSGSSGAADVAVLRLDAALPGAGPVRLVEAQDLWEHRVRAFGLPAGRPGGVWHSGVLRARQANGWVQADLVGDGYPVSRGFSGTPVWDETLVGVVGMVAVAESGRPPVSYLIPTSGLLAAWSELRAVALPPSPFRGLSAFQESDAAVFHGRQAESDELAALLASEQRVTVVGPSGSGKSSLAMAGVVPRLRTAGALAVVVRPASGSSPLSALAAALLPLLEPGLSETQRLARIPDLAAVLRRPGGLADLVSQLLDRCDSRRLLVVVDQCEELLDLPQAVVDELAGVLFADSLPRAVRVLATLRSDFLDAVLAHPSLGPILGRRIQAIGPLEAERLREIVTAPVDAIPGVRYEPHLADRILAETGTEPGALPLLGLTLDLLWQRQTGGLLTHQAYEQLGGVAGALSAYADRVWGDYVPAAEEQSARRLFTRLMRMPLGSAAVTRRMVLRSELGVDEWQIAQRLAATRLLVASRSAEGVETVELAHEALITGWPRLAEWAVEERSFLEWRESLRHDMERWERGGRAPELLPTAAALADAQRWLRDRASGLTDAERDYLHRGRTYHRSRTRRRRALFSGVALVAVLALLFGTLFTYVRHQSQERAAQANSRALTQLSQYEEATDPVRSAMLAMAAYQTSPTQEARNQLLRRYLALSTATRDLSGLLGNIAQFQTSRDGNVVLARSVFGRAMLFVHDTTGAVHSEALPTSALMAVMVAPDGRRAAYVREDGTAGWFDVNTNSAQPMGPVHQLPGAGQLVEYSDDPQRGFAMSPDGRIMAAVEGEDLVWWDLNRGTTGGSAAKPADISGKMWIAPDNRTL